MAGRVYDRKGHLNVDDLTGPRNQAYGSNRDDYVVGVLVRIPASSPGPRAELHYLEGAARGLRVKQAEAEYDRLQKAYEALDAELNERNS